MSACSIETVVIGGGQAGLATSYCLREHGCEHIILERARIGESWRSKRWDSFTLVTPNWTLQLPGFPYQGQDPDGFLARDEIVAYLEGYAQSFAAPMRCGVHVTSLEPAPHGDGYLVTTNDGLYQARNVVIATGGFHRPNIPAFSTELPSDILQLDASEYRNSDGLPAGAVLVVGSGQSGAQIAEELHECGRRVYLAVGSAGRIPRRYRGKDNAWWLVQMAKVDGAKTVDQLPSPRAKFAANPHVSGKNGGHDINLRRLGRDGVILLGRLRGVQGQRLIIAPDLEENLEKADDGARKFKKGVDEFIQKMGWDLPVDSPLDEDERLRNVPLGNSIRELDIRNAQITTVIWATGYRPEFDWVRIPVVDEDGYPIQRRGVSNYPGLYFLGLPWLYTLKSALLLGVGEDAAHIASVIAERVGNVSAEAAGSR